VYGQIEMLYNEKEKKNRNTYLFECLSTANKRSEKKEKKNQFVYHKGEERQYYNL